MVKIPIEGNHLVKIVDLDVVVIVEWFIQVNGCLIVHNTQAVQRAIVT